MYRALYDYSSNEADVLHIKADDKFVFIREHDSSWWQMQAEDGQVGLVPENYLTPDEQEMQNPIARKAILQSVERAMELIHAHASENGGKYTCEQRSNLKKLLDHRKAVLSPAKSSSPKRTPPITEANPPAQPSRPAPTLPQGSSKTSSKRKAPAVPSSFSPVASATIETQTSLQTLQCEACSTSSSSAPQKDFPEIVIPSKFVTDLLEELRINSGISYATLFVVAETVVNHIKKQIPHLAVPMDQILKGVINEKENAVHSDQSFLSTHDGQSIENILTALTQHKDDAQQRSWALHMDEPTILAQIGQLFGLLLDANQKVSKAVLAQNDFEYLQSLVVYFQMEHRLSIRLQLLQVFGCICGIDKEVITQLLCSVLPGELGRTIQDAQHDLPVQLQSSLILTMIFSTAEPVPHWLYDQLDNNFVTFLVMCIENAPVGEEGDQIIDSFVALILSFNQHFSDFKSNIVMEVLASFGTAKNFSEKIMLLINRGEDPAFMFDYPKYCLNSVLKFLSDMFSGKSTSGLFFTTDLMVLLEITLRQITDLNPGNQLRTENLSLLHLIVTNTNYAEHKHLSSDIHTCLTRISQEVDKESQKDQYIVREIFTNFSNLFS